MLPIVLIKSLLDRIRGEQLIQKLGLLESDIIRKLDDRDTNDFDSKWMSAFRLVECSKTNMTDDSELQAALAQVREVTYLQAIRQWQSADLAGYISDDFALIGDALAFGINDPWINGLWCNYATGHFPPKDISEMPGILAELVCVS